MSLSREFAAFVAGLRYEDLPAAVVDRAKGVTLQALSSALVAHDMPASRQALALMQEEEAGGGGAATVLCNGAKLTKAGAAFVNAEMIFAGGKWDTFRMLTHPGTAILPAALVAGEIAGLDGEGVPHRRRSRLRGHGAHGRRVHPDRDVARLPRRAGVRDFRRGGRGGENRRPRRRPDPRRHRAMRQPGVGQSRRHPQRRPLAARGRRGAQRAARGGDGASKARRAAKRRSKATPAFTTPMPATIAASCATASPATTAPTSARSPQTSASDWIFLETLYRIYSTAGYNIAHVDVTAELCGEHNIAYADIDRIEAVVNWFETEYPSPPFRPRRSTASPSVGSTQYFTAYGAVTRGYPMLRRRQPGPGESDPPEVLDLMHRVTLIPMVRRTLFGPRITVFTKDGRSFTSEGTGREFIWDFEEQARRISPINPGLAIGEAQFAELIDTCRRLDGIDNAAQRLIALTIPD